MVSIKSKKRKEKKNIFFFFTFLNWEKQTWYWEKRWLFSIGNGAETWPLEKGRKSPVHPPLLCSLCLNKHLMHGSDVHNYTPIMMVRDSKG